MMSFISRGAFSQKFEHDSVFTKWLIASKRVLSHLVQSTIETCGTLVPASSPIGSVASVKQRV